MDETRRYEIEGLIIDIPIYKTQQNGKIIERYPDFIDNPVWTPKGHRVLFCGTDACAVAVEASPGGCFDCGSCKYFKRAAERTWFGVCKNKHSPPNREKKKKENT